MRLDYTQIDNDILAAIRQAPREFAAFNTKGSNILNQAEALAKQSGLDRWNNEKPGWRVIDMRLQSLRRCGLIKYVKATGWTAVPQ